MGDRRKSARRRAASDDAPDDMLELVFLRLPSSLQLIRVAITCKRWRRVVADRAFLLRFRALHPHAPVAGHYRVDQPKPVRRPSGSNPEFRPSSRLPPAVQPHHFQLKPLQQSLGGGDWELADSRGGVLLLLKERARAAPCHLPDFVACDPLTRRSVVIPSPPKLRGYLCFGAFLLDGDGADETGGLISLANFRVLIALWRNGAATACVFSSRGGGDDDGWVVDRSTADCGNLLSEPCFAGLTAESVYWTIAYDVFIVLHKGTGQFSSFTSDYFPSDRYLCSDHYRIVRVVGREDDTLRIVFLTTKHLKVFRRLDQHSGQWELENMASLWKKVSALYRNNSCISRPTKIVSDIQRSVLLLGSEQGPELISVNLDTMEFNHFPVSERNRYDDGLLYIHQLPWPPLIRACLPGTL